MTAPTPDDLLKPAEVEAANGRSLNNLLVNALHTAQRIHFEHAGDVYAVTAWDGLKQFTATSATPAEALHSAMRLMAAAREQAKAGS